VIVYPAITLILTAAAVVTGLLPFLSKRRRNTQLQLLRQSAAQDAVLGAPAVPEVGKPEVVGLVVTVPKLVKTVGEFPNGESIAGATSKIQIEQRHVAEELAEHQKGLNTALETVAQELADQRETVKEALEVDHADLKGLLDQHAETDRKSFKAIQDTLETLAPKE